ncbi:MAG: glycosyltransferase family 4 protein [Pseudomonadota bacterium]
MQNAGDEIEGPSDPSAPMTAPAPAPMPASIPTPRATPGCTQPQGREHATTAHIEDTGSGRIVLVAPRNTRFSPESATSIDLYIHEIARQSRLASRITVFAQRTEHPFEDVDLRSWVGRADRRTLASEIAETNPALVVVHQHLPTAAHLGRAFPDLPVALVRHNFVKAPRHLLSAWAKRRQIAELSGLAFVSECCREVFEREWPQSAGRTGWPDLFVTPNGIDQGLWRPGPKARRLLFVGRLAPEKGVLEAAEAVGRVLPAHPDWEALFILDAKSAEPRYRNRTIAAIEAAGPHVRLMTNLPHDAVRAEMAAAAIAIAPTQNTEPFGRVAVEALASGCALVAARAGGFIEIAGDTAGVLLETPSTENIALALKQLMADPDRVAALGRAGRERVVATYSLDAAAAAFDAMAAALIGSAQKRVA